MVMKILSQQVQKDGVTVLLMSPGWVRTDMGGENAMISVDESAKGITDTVNSIGIDKTGVFVNYDGKELPW
jgi:NAD(P)-dependent dehydrogenase (short-subunit alcohol dehydrogenase family)